MSIIWGMVSRVSPPAQSIGLFLLHRGGNKSPNCAIRSSGRSTKSSTPSRAIASAVTTPQPPTVVSTTTRLPRGSGCVENEAATSNARSMSSTRIAPVARHTPSNTLSSLAKAPVWLEAALLPAVVAPPLTTTSGLRSDIFVIADLRRSPFDTCSMYAKPTRVLSSVVYQSK